MSSLMRHLYNIQGCMDVNIQAFHEKYGQVVRHGPSEVSFVSSRAWQNIYGRVTPIGSPDKVQLPKITTRGETNGPESIINASDDSHSRMRKLLWSGFNDKGILDRGNIVNRYLNDLTKTFALAMKDGSAVDVGNVLDEWNANFLEDFAFTGDKTKSTKSTRVEVDAIYQWHYQTPFLRMAEDFPILASFFGYFRPRGWKTCRQRIVAHAKNNVLSRLSDASEQSGDLLSLALSDEKSPNKIPEAVGNAAVMIIAGSDAASTAMTGTLYWLFRSPHALRKVQEELRDTFESEEDITISVSESKTPYLMACVHEGLRLYPPAPGIFYRRVPEGQTIEIDGNIIPAKACQPFWYQAVEHVNAYNKQTLVGVCQRAASQYPGNFNKPTEFIPERWFESGSESPYHKDQL